MRKNNVSKIAIRSFFLLCIVVFVILYILTSFTSLTRVPMESISFALLAGFLSRTIFLSVASFLLASYTLFCQIKQNKLDEVIRLIPGAYNRTQNHLARLLFAAALIYSAFLFILMICLANKQDALYPAVIVNMLMAVILYTFLPSVMGITWGWACHKYVPSIAFGIFTFCVAFLFSPISLDLYMSIGSLGTKIGGIGFGSVLQRIGGFFYNTLPVYDNTISSTYGLSVELHRWAVILFWILLGVAVILFQNRKIRWAALLTFVFCVVLAVSGYRRGSVGSIPLYHDIVLSEKEDYDEKGFYRYTKKEQLADFLVTSYDLDFRFSDMLHATAEMDLKGVYREEYTFTLYHEYKVNKVEGEDGQTLKFMQEGDYLHIINPGREALHKIRISYCGWSLYDYANWQGAYLPGFSFYYPVEGEHSVYSVPQVQLRNFDVTIQGLISPTVNLEKVNSHSWKGKTQWLGIVGGMYRVEDIQTYHYVLPVGVKATDVMTPLARVVKEYNEQWGLDVSLDGIRYIIYSPSEMLPKSREGGSSLFCGDVLYINYSPYQENNPESLLRDMLVDEVSIKETDAAYWYVQILNAVLRDNLPASEVFRREFGPLYDGEYQQVSFMSEEENRRREFGFYLGHVVEKSGENMVMKELHDYVLSSETDDIAFVKKLFATVAEENQEEHTKGERVSD